MIFIEDSNITLLTTIDNPYDPFEEWDDWYSYDTEMNYNTCSYLARIANASDELSDEENDELIEQAMNEIIEFNILGIYTLVHPGEVKKKREHGEIVTNLAAKLNKEITNNL